MPLHPRLGGGDAATQSALARAAAAGLGRPTPRPAAPPTAILVLLVECADRPHAGNQTPAAIEALFFGPAPSLRDYYRRASHGRYTPAGTTTSWQRLPQAQAFYAGGSRGIGGVAPHNARTLVADAVRVAYLQVDFTQFDNDGPDGVPASGDDYGIVDALVVVHTGGTAETSGVATDLLSHSWLTEDPVQTDDRVLVWTYTLVGAISPLGVRVHEFGQLLGLPDLYSRRAVSRQAPGGVGDWSLMGSGAWLGDGEQPADLDDPSKIWLGFVDPIVPTTNASGFELAAARDDAPPTLYQVWTHGVPGLEYFVLENRRPAATSLQGQFA